MRKILPALGIVLISLGGLAWQLERYRQRERDARVPKAAPQPFTAPMHWHEAPTALRLAVATSIRGQLAALKRGDFQAAQKYQSQELRRRFPTVAEFQGIVETQQPLLAHYKSASFFFVNTDPGEQNSNAGLRLTGAEGGPLEVVFHMILEDGAWRVNGVSSGENPVSRPTAPTSS